MKNILEKIDKGEFELSVTACNKATNWTIAHVYDANEKILHYVKMGMAAKDVFYSSVNTICKLSGAFDESCNGFNCKWYDFCRLRSEVL